MVKESKVHLLHLAQLHLLAAAEEDFNLALVGVAALAAAVVVMVLVLVALVTHLLQAQAKVIAAGLLKEVLIVLVLLVVVAGQVRQV